MPFVFRTPDETLQIRLSGMESLGGIGEAGLGVRVRDVIVLLQDLLLCISPGNEIDHEIHGYPSSSDRGLPGENLGICLNALAPVGHAAILQGLVTGPPGRVFLLAGRRSLERV